MAKSRVESRALKALDVVNVARRLLAAYKQWNESTEPGLLRMWNGAPTKFISEDLHRNIEQACDATADLGLDVEPSARGLLLIFDDLEYFFMKWLQDASMQLPTAPPRGSNEIHNCMDRLTEKLRAQSLPQPRPIKQLVAEKVSPHQIAIIYGWKNPEDNSPDTAKVHEEIEAPGTHYDAAQWVHPALKVIQAEVDKQWSEREPRGKSFESMQPEVKAPAPVIPTLDELFALKAPKAQILRLHKDLTEDDLEFQAAERGLSLVEDRFIIPANEAVAHSERMAELEAAGR